MAKRKKGRSGIRNTTNTSGEPKDKATRDKVKFVSDFCQETDRQTLKIKAKWRENFLQFKEGSLFPDKEDWMSDVSSGKFETRIRAAAGQARDILVNNPDWFDIDPTLPEDERAQQLATICKKAVKYYLRKAKFPRKASTLLLSAFISMGSCMVGWTQQLVQNPKHVLRKGRKEQEREQKALAPHVENARNTLQSSPEELIADVQNAFNSLPAILSGDEVKIPEPEEKPYLQHGGLDLRVVNPENRFWDTVVQYIDESPMGAHVEHQPLWKIRALADKGYFLKDAVEKITPKQEDMRWGVQKGLYSDLNRAKPAESIELTYYFGPLIIDGKVKKERWGCILAEKEFLIKEWEDYPYWEPPSHEAHPYIDSAVKEVPWRATGAGVGDNAVKLARMHDSNINLMNDAMRFNTIGFNIIDINALIEPDQIEEGLAPGINLKVRKKPKEVYEHVSITSNIEKQWDPVNQKLEDAIDDQMGMSRLSLGGPTQRSRTTAAEIRAQSQGADSRINNIAIDLEQTFLIPFLEKVLARVLQFGFSEIDSNTELAAQFTEDEKRLIKSLSAEQRLEALNTYFNIKVKGFSAETDKQETLNKLGEVLTMVNAGGPLGQMTNPIPIMKRMLQLLDLHEEVDGVVIEGTEAETIIMENQLLAKNIYIEPREQDNHEAHIQSHTQDPNPTPEKQAHVQMHQEIMMQMQQAQAMQQQQALPPGESGPMQ